MRDRKTQAMVILERLQAAGDVGVTNIELNKTCLRYGARIYDLRNLGHNIETCDDGKGIFRFIFRQPMKFEQIALPGMSAPKSYQDPEEATQL